MTQSVHRSPGVTVRAAAKINLHLGVGAPREDGFHPLATVFQAVGLCDDVTVSADEPWEIQVSTPSWMPDGAVPTDASNLVARAADLLSRHHDVPLGGRVAIDKAIPVAGGLAGGSANGAAALVALDRAFDLATSDDDLLALAAELGSDVPFALVGGTALGRGRGELLDHVADGGTWWWVMVPSAEGLSTPDVYRHHDRLRPDAPVEPEVPHALLEALAAGEPLALARHLHNDLEAAAVDLRPELGELIARGESEGALRGMVSGSGPTVVFLAESADHARDLAGALMRGGHDVVLVANGAVAGAHVVTSYA